MALDAWGIGCACCPAILLYAMFARVPTLALLKGETFTSQIFLVALIFKFFPCSLRNLHYSPFLQKEKAKAAEVLSNIYDPFRLEDELDLLAAAAEEERKKRAVHISDVFRRKELRLAFIAGGGLLVRFSFLDYILQGPFMIEVLMHQ